MLEKIMNAHVLLYAMVSIGALGGVAMLATNLTYRRSIRNTKNANGVKEKYIALWAGRDRLLHRMNRLVWYPSIFTTGLLVWSLYLVTKGNFQEGLSLSYLYVGTAVPVVLMLLRHGLDFSYMEELLVSSLTDYVKAYVSDSSRYEQEEVMDPVLREEVVEQITAGIRQSAAAGSHFSRMLSPEEEEIMREIIREFMH